MLQGNQQAHYQMPYMLEGEVIEVNDAPLKDLRDTERAVGYTILVEFPNGSRTVYRNVIQACMFGGIGDFFQSRLRSSSDAGGQFNLPKTMGEAEKTITSVGSRVLVQFLAGDMRRPIIVGHLPHPARVFDVPNYEDNETQAKLSYKGFEITVSATGEVKMTRRGNPTERDRFIEEETDSYEYEEVGPNEMEEREILTPLPSPAMLPVWSDKVLTEATLPDPIPNDRLTYPDRKYTTEMGFKHLGEWYVVDSEGQQIMLDRDSKTITLTNGEETIQFDKANKKILIYSSGDIETTTEANHYTTIAGDKHQTIELNGWSVILGDEYHSVGSTRTTNITDSDTLKVGSSLDVMVGSADEIEGGAGTSQEKHRVSFSLSTGNAFVMDDDSIVMAHKSGATISIDKDGNLIMMAADGTNFNLNGGSGVYTLMSKFGAFLSVDDKITCVDKTGKQMIVVKEGMVEITAADQVTVSGKTVSINAGNVNVGDKAMMSAVCGENLQAWLDQHTHVAPGGPTSPPVIPSASLKASPMDILSTAVKIRKGM
jgi:hypothetical protein